MTVKERIIMIRMMERMEEMYRNNDNQVTKSEDGTLNYIGQNGEVLIEAKRNVKA